MTLKKQNRKRLEPKLTRTKPNDSLEIRNLEKSLFKLISSRTPLVQSLARINTGIDTVHRELVRLRYGVQIGTVVRHKGKLYRVIHMKYWEDGGLPWLYGNVRQKDGNFSDKRSNLFDKWEVTTLGA